MPFGVRNHRWWCYLYRRVCFESRLRGIGAGLEQGTDTHQPFHHDTHITSWLTPISNIQTSIWPTVWSSTLSQLRRITSEAWDELFTIWIITAYAICHREYWFNGGVTAWNSVISCRHIVWSINVVNMGRKCLQYWTKNRFTWFTIAWNGHLHAITNQL